MNASHQTQHADDETMTGEVLSSIRRLLHENEAVNTTQSGSGQSSPDHSTAVQSTSDAADDIELTLDGSMMVSSPPETRSVHDEMTSESASPSELAKETTPESDDLMNAHTVAAAERSLDELHAAFTGLAPVTSGTVVSRASGITIEDMVRGEVRSMVRTWLDAHLPSLVEILVRAEIARLRPRE